MTFSGKSLGEAAQQLADHLNRILAQTVTRSRLVVLRRPLPAGTPARMELAFRQGGTVTTAPLQTLFGPMRLFLGLVCEPTVGEHGVHRLSVVGYKYALTPGAASEPLFRWEFVSRPPHEGRWSRHHLQGSIPLGLRDRRVPGAGETWLNDLHLPTGWVPIEEILRFCIVDLGVRPLSNAWHAELEASVARFSLDTAPPEDT